MSEWITDRRPTEKDADGEGDVLIATTDNLSGWRITGWKDVEDEPWMSPPKPYQPPEPDMSLAESIDRCMDCLDGLDEDESTVTVFKDDLYRIVEAAMAWNLHQVTGGGNTDE